MYRSILSTLLFVSLCADPAAAREEISSENTNLWVYGKLGTHGWGAGMGYVINDAVVVRIGFNSGGTVTGSRRIDDIRYDYSRNTDAAVEALLDWYPMDGSGFRLTGGLIVTDTRTTLDARADKGGNYVINGNHYAATEIGDLNSRVRPDAVSPYLGLGWESERPGKRGFRFVSEVGVHHLRGDRASLIASGDSSNDRLRTDLVAEQGRIKEVNDIALGVSVGFSYGF